MSESLPRVTLGDLANRALAAADAESRAVVVGQLAQGTRSEEQIAAMADRLLSLGPPAHRLYLEWIAEVRAKDDGDLELRVRVIACKEGKCLAPSVLKVK
jgi:hypothetical protein